MERERIKCESSVTPRQINYRVLPDENLPCKMYMFWETTLDIKYIVVENILYDLDLSNISDRAYVCCLLYVDAT